MTSKDGSRSKVAVITGANTGIGFNLAQRIVKAYPDIQLCLACRNQSKAQDAAASISKLYPGANVSIVLLDTSSLQSVLNAAKELRERFDHIDYLYLNAGMFMVTGVDWSYFWRGLFSRRVFFMFTTGEGLLIHRDNVTDDGLQNVFETNVFGHYILVKELGDRLGNATASTGDHSSVSQLIWTSSSNALKENFNSQDIQHKNGKDPYSSSKFAMDLVSVGLNQRMKKQNVYSHSTCPGLVMTNLTYGILPPWFWTLVMPFMFLLRLFVPSMTCSTSNGSEALFWLSKQNPSTLDPETKFESVVSCPGKAYVRQEKMNIDLDEAEQLLKQLDKLDTDLRHRLID